MSNVNVTEITVAHGDGGELTTPTGAEYIEVDTGAVSYFLKLKNLIYGVTAKTTPVDADRFGLYDSVSTLLNYVTWANIKATIFTAIGALTGKTTPVDADTLVISDSAASGVGKSVTWANIKATLKVYLDTLYLALVAPGTSGNVLTSNGTIWTSAVPNGWTPIAGTFSYASASTITISAGGASVYAVGDRLKWITATGSTQRYAAVVAVADTLLTIAVNTDHVLVNEAWTLPYYSHVASPVGYPHWFTYLSTVNGSTGTIGSYAETSSVSKFTVVGNLCHTQITKTITNVGSWTGTFQVARPIPEMSSSSMSENGKVVASGAITPKAIINGTNNSIFAFITGNGAGYMTWGGGGAVANDWIVVDSVYQI